MVEEISVQALSLALEKKEDIVLLDVRTVEEHERADIGGILIPLNELPDRVNELNKDDAIVVYCLRGHRSYHGAEFLLTHGFKRVKNLTGGILAWAHEIGWDSDR